MEFSEAQGTFRVSIPINPYNEDYVRKISQELQDTAGVLNIVVVPYFSRRWDPHIAVDFLDEEWAKACAVKYWGYLGSFGEGEQYGVQE
jgi:hypothetical protein